MIAVSAACIRYALEPVASLVCALAVFTVFGYLFEITKYDSFKKQIFYGVFAALATTIISFGWVYTGIRNITGFSHSASVLSFLVYAILFQLKISILFPANRFLSKYTSLYTRGILLLIIPDLIFYQLFPWYWGNLFTGSFVITQSASIFGIHGVSIIGWTIAYPLVVIILGFLSSNEVDAKTIWREKCRFLIRILVSKKWTLLIVVLLIGSLYFYAKDREGRLASLSKKGTLTIAMVQPSIEIGSNNKRDTHSYVQNALQISFNYGLKAIIDSEKMLDLLIFPESSIPFHTTNAYYMHPKYNYSSTFHGIMTMLARTGKQSVLFNETNYKESSDKSQGSVPEVKKGNSVTLMNPSGKRDSVYQKKYLLPMGEYIPEYLEKKWNFRALFPEAGTYTPDLAMKIGYYEAIPDKIPEKLDAGSLDLTLLDSPEKINAQGQTPAKLVKRYFLAVLCYEAMFPNYTNMLIHKADKENKPLDFIVNPVNDAWFGNGIENYQHLNSARFRAVETGLHLLRSAMSGVSVIIDPLGRDASKMLHPSENGVIIEKIQRGRIDTMFTYWGFIPVYLFLFVIIMITFIRIRRS